VTRREQGLELLSFAVLAAGDIDVFLRDASALRFGKGSKLGELVLVVLLGSRDAAIDRDVHT